MSFLPITCMILLYDTSLSSESLNFKKPEESNIFVSTKKEKYYGTLQAKQKYKQTSCGKAI